MGRQKACRCLKGWGWGVFTWAKYAREIRIKPDKELWSIDVSALFTSVPVDKALEVI